MVDIYLCIVLYKTNLTTSSTLVSLRDIKANYKRRIKRIFLWDNSPNRILDSKIKSFESLTGYNIDYRWAGENLPLSKIYNRTIKLVPDDSILVLLDHDSILDDNYFKQLFQNLEIYHEINLFVPKINYNKQLVSPAFQLYFYGQYLKEIESGIVKSKNKMAINSCMAIRTNYLKKEFDGYNEEISFYGTDNDFMYRYQKYNKYFILLDCEISHELNYYENTNKEDILQRLKDMEKGSLILMKSINIIIYWLAKVYWFLYKIKIRLFR